MGGIFSRGQNTVTEADRISEFQINQATYGNVVPIIFGTTRVAGNIIDYYNFNAIQHSETTRTGKGGGGGSSSTNITYTYKAAVLIGICEGPIAAIGRVWQGSDTITTLADLGFTLYGGWLGQEVDAYTQSVAPSHSLPYSGLAYIAGYVDLNSSGGMYTYNFEVAGLMLGGNGVDCNPADICSYILSDAVNGINISGIDAVSLSNFRTFAAAADLLGSLPLTDQSRAYEIVNNICEACDVMVFDSQGELKFVPRCEDTIGGYTPDLTTQYDLDEDDFLPFDDGTLVKFDRSAQSETYNQVTVEYINRANNYETETVDKQVLADVSTRGLRPASTKSYHFFHSKARAEQVAMRLALKSCYDRVTYTFRLPWTFCLLEPGDIVKLSLSTGPFLLSGVPVRIETVEEDNDGELEITAKPLMNGIASPAKYAVFDSDRAIRDYNVDPGNVSTPMFFQIPATLTGNIQKVMLAAAGGPSWGGCQVWISDDGDTYKQVGELNGKTRYGIIVSDSGTSIVINMISGELNSGTAADAQNARTLCYADGELFSYETATLTGANQYTLTGLVRGQYSTAQVNHATGVQFARVDMDRLFGYEYLVGDIGKTIYVKLPSTNVFGSGLLELAEVTAYRYTILDLFPPDVPTLFVEQLANGRRRFIWFYDYPTPNDVKGFRVRVYPGSAPYWDTGTAAFDGVVGASPWETDMLAAGTYTVMVKAVDNAGNESENAAISVIGLGDELVENILETHDLSDWSGTLTGCRVYDDNVVVNDPGVKMWSDNPEAPLWTSDNDPMYRAQYRNMVYEDSFTALAEGNLLIQSAMQGNAAVYYREAFPLPMWGGDNDPMWTDDNNGMWTPGIYLPYNGKININRGQVDIKTIIGAGPIEGKITELTALVDVADLPDLYLNDVVIAACGTNLILPHSCNAIKGINISVQDDGGSAVYAKVIDKVLNGTTAWKVQCYNISGAAVAGTIDAQIDWY